MNNKKFGTLVLYDAENLKIPKEVARSYAIPHVDIEKLTDSIKNYFGDIHYDFVSFGKRFYDFEEKKNAAIDRHNSRLKKLGYTIIEKTIMKKEGIIRIDGKRTVYTYEEGDLDSMIVFYILAKGKDYDRVVLVSGDYDMSVSLNFLKSEYGTEVWIISHKERLSRKYKDNDNTLSLDYLIGG